MHYEMLSGFSDEIAEDIDTQFGVLRKLNMKYFEVRGVNGKNIAELTEKEVMALKEKMKEYGIRASSIGSPIGKVKLEEDFEIHFAQFKRVVEIAKMLETGYIRLFSFYHEGGEEWSEWERSQVLARMRQMIDYAAGQGMVLLHENEKEIYGDTVDRCADLMQELGCDHFRAVFDPANFVQCGQNTMEAYERLKGYIAYVHVKDALLADGRVVPAGAGDGNVEYVLGRLFESGYKGFLSLEPHLGSFAGLEGLELDDKMSSLPQGGEGTFTLALRALESLLDGMLPIAVS